MATWLAVISLFISIASVAVALYVAISNSQLKKAQIRSDILSQLFDLRQNYTDMKVRLAEFKRKNPTFEVDSTGLGKTTEDMILKYETDFDEIYKAILGPKRNISAVKLLDGRHLVERLCKLSLELTNLIDREIQLYSEQNNTRDRSTQTKT